MQETRYTYGKSETVIWHGESRHIYNYAKATSPKRAKLTTALYSTLPAPIATAKHCSFLETSTHRKGAVSINNQTYLAKLKLKDIKIYTKEKKKSKNQTGSDFDVYFDGFIRNKRFREFPQVEQDYC